MKIVIRENLPETNSSSSHSIVINSRKIDYSLPTPLNGKIHLNLSGYDEYSCLGRQWQRTRNTIGKLTYIISAFCTNGSGGGDYGGLNSKKLMVLSSIVEDVTGYPLDIEEILAHKDKIPSIDHQEVGNELFTNNKDILKNFIFNKNSVLLLGSDEGGDPDNYFKLGDESDYSIASAVYSIDFKGDVGEIDFVIKDYPIQNKTVLEMITGDSINLNLLQSIGYDITAKKTRFISMKEAINNGGSYYFTSDTLILPDIWGSITDTECGSKENKLIFGNSSKDFVEFPIKFKKILWKNQ